jgi:6-phosphofructokinase 1
MSTKFRRIGVLTSGGDAPGMNATVRAVTRYAEANGVQVVGIYEGYKGLIDGNMKVFSSSDVANIIHQGGTILYTARCPEFKTEEGMQKAIKNCEKFQIDGIVAIGGDGTFRGATDLSVRGIPTIGLPGTIDNDITATETTIGYDTAMNTSVEMIDHLRDTCESHARCDVIEVMGRNAGYIALNVGMAVGATAVCTVEVPFQEEDIIRKIKNSRAGGKRNFLVVVSEGLVDYAEGLTQRIEEQTGVESRFARLAHVVRGGSPTLADRKLASTMGVEAVKLLLDGKSDLVVCQRDGKICTTEISYALKLDKLFKSKYAGYKKVDEEELLKDYTPKQREEMNLFCQKMLDAMKSIWAENDAISK